MSTTSFYGTDSQNHLSLYSNDLKNEDNKQGVSVLGVVNLREYANAPKFYEANSSKQKSIPKVIIYTDGACSGNPGPGGWGALLQFNGVCKEIFGHELHTTNNRMEMIAAIEALKILKKSCCVELYTDSKYLQLGITQWINTWIKNNWHKNNNDPIKNVDLWKNLYEELGKHYIIWNWVKGHGNNEGNKIADRLAVKGKETAIKILKCHS